MNTEERIVKVLANVNEKILTYDGPNMMEDGTLDSFELIEIVSQLEEEFDFEIDAEYAVIENFGNKDTIIALMKKLLGE
ncbi:MAG TPA: hypothetical protein O0X70_02920 [Methanocorpusculum sp.]|nr:hypothetical protein [Methanocorpusculum sp.]